jgi:hypothetical protein
MSFGVERLREKRVGDGYTASYYVYGAPGEDGGATGSLILCGDIFGGEPTKDIPLFASRDSGDPELVLRYAGRSLKRNYSVVDGATGEVVGSVRHHGAPVTVMDAGDREVVQFRHVSTVGAKLLHSATVKDQDSYVLIARDTQLGQLFPKRARVRTSTPGSNPLKQLVRTLGGCLRTVINLEPRAASLDRRLIVAGSLLFNEWVFARRKHGMESVRL